MACALTLPFLGLAQLMEAEPNDGWNQNNPVPLGSTMSGSIGTCGPTNSSVDVFELTLTNVGRLQINTTMSNSGTTPTVTMSLHNNSVGLIQTFTVNNGVNGASVQDNISISCRGTGVYYLYINAPAAGCLNYTFDYALAQPLFGADMESNSAWNSANTDTVPVSTNADGRINFSQNDDNSDYFILELDDDGVLNINVEAEQVSNTSNDSLTVRLYSTSVALQRTWRVKIGANSTPVSSDISMNCRGIEERYFLQFASDACGTSYRFSYDVSPPVFADDLEENDAWNYANTDTVAVNTDAEGRINFNYDDNSDYFILELDDDGVLNIHVEAEQVSNSPNDSLTVRLYNTSMALQRTWRVRIGANSTPFSSDISMNCRGNEERYFLQFASDACGTSYRFSYDVSPPVFADDLEENDAWNYANTDTVAVNTDAEGRLNFNYDDNSDYFILELNDDGVLNVYVDAEQVGSSTNDSLTIRLYSSSVALQETWRVKVGANSTPSNTSTSINCRGNEQRYFLQFASDACGTSYRFSYDVTLPVFADDLEENDGWNSVNTDTVAVNTEMDGRLKFNYDDNSDYFILDLDDDGILNIHVEAEQVSASQNDSLTIRLYSSSVALQKTWRVKVGANSTPFSSDINMTCRGNEERYFLQFASDACETSYRFSYDVTPPVFEDDTEENDAWNSANTDTIAVNTVQNGRLNFNYDDNSDYFILDLDDDGILNIHVEAEHVSATPDDSLTMRLYNSSVALQKTWRVKIGAISAPFSTDISMTCRGNEQRYFLQFTSDACGTSYRYSYDVSPPVFADDMEDNDAWNSANTSVIDLNMGAVEGRLNFNYDDNTDYYKVILNAVTTITINSRAENANASGTYDVRLFSGSVALLNTHEFAVGNGSVPASDTWTSASLAAGTYYLQALNAPCGTSYTFDCFDDDSDGTCNGADVCAGGPEPGTPCDDGNPDTENDEIGTNCLCSGIILGIAEANESSTLRVWPNPAHGNTLFLSENTSGQIMDATGKQVNSFQRTMVVNIHDLAPGMYVIRTNEGAIVRFIRE